MKEHRDIGWRYWLVTVGLLVVGLYGWKTALYAAIALSMVQMFHFAWREFSLTAFSVQARIAYLGLLVLGLWTPLQFVHWIQLIGTSVRVLTGYCFLARTLSLLPWNRIEPLSWKLLHRTFFSLLREVRCGGGYACAGR